MGRNGVFTETGASDAGAVTEAVTDGVGGDDEALIPNQVISKPYFTVICSCISLL